MWASAASTKVVVTTQVEWTGRSFIKGKVLFTQEVPQRGIDYAQV